MGSCYSLRKETHLCTHCASSLKLYNHCCTQQCFVHKDAQRPQLLKSLKKYTTKQIKLDDLINLILDYLPENQYEILKLSPAIHNGYNIYRNTPGLLCPIWSTYYQRNKCINIIILGDRGIGKTSLITRFASGTFSESYLDPTEDHRQHIIVNKQKYCLSISDFAGQEMIYHSITDDLFRCGQIFLCCFSINSQLSYEKAINQREKILRCKDDDSDWAILLVALKCDLIHTTDSKEKQKTFVNSNRVIEKAKEWRIGYIETSAKDDINAKFLFEQSILEYWIQSQRHQCCHISDITEK